MHDHFTGEQLSDLPANIRKEWVMTNGLGGYAGGSVTGAMCRNHQGYLIASLHPPVERYLLLAGTKEHFTQDGTFYDLETSQHAGAPLSAEKVVDAADLPEEYRRADTVNVAADFVPRRPVYAEGQRYLTAFDYDGAVAFTYRAGALTIRKTIALEHGENTVAVGYEITNEGDEAEFAVTPLFNYREHSASSSEASLRFREELITDDGTCLGLRLFPEAKPELAITLRFSRGSLRKRDERFDKDMQYQIEVDNETPGLDTHYTPYDLTVPIPARASVSFSLVCSAVLYGKEDKYATAVDDSAAQFVADATRSRIQDFIDLSGYGDDAFASSLVAASDQFLAYRSSTGLATVLAGLPWFTDWGRDTMIAFSGLTLATKRFEEAQEILVTFSRYLRHGLVPNMFPDDGQEPLYNTADASLWYFYAVDQYLRYTGNYEFVKAELYPALKEIIAAYEKGTDYSIYMDKDGLIHAGSGVDQVTWMDVRVGDWVVTPRHGKPVEINALWYNALMVMGDLADRFGEDGTDYLKLAEKVKASFNEKFWNGADGCLYDVVDGENKDASIRPNQIYAVSLPYTMLPAEKALAVVDTVERELYAGPGIRSLAPGHRDYHGIYCGSLPKRDAAYHQGTAWGFPMGGFITAYLKVHGKNETTRKKALDFLAPVKAHLEGEGCIGSISEIFDGDSPHTCRGCYAQAWSVGEVLRCYTEDILKK